MSYEEYKFISELVDVFLKNWVSGSYYSQKNELDIEFKCGLMVVYTTLFGKIRPLIEIVESYPDYKEKYMKEAGYTTPPWAEEVIPK